MDLHRIRFIPHLPQPIHCLSFFDNDVTKLAVSRSDGSLEVWNSINDNFVKELWIPGRASTSIEALQWCGKRLYTGSLLGTLYLHVLKQTVISLSVFDELQFRVMKSYGLGY